MSLKDFPRTLFCFTDIKTIEWQFFVQTIECLSLYEVECQLKSNVQSLFETGDQRNVNVNVNVSVVEILVDPNSFGGGWNASKGYLLKQSFSFDGFLKMKYVTL